MTLVYSHSYDLTTTSWLRKRRKIPPPPPLPAKKPTKKSTSTASTSRSRRISRARDTKEVYFISAFSFFTKRFPYIHLSKNKKRSEKLSKSTKLSPHPSIPFSKVVLIHIKRNARRPSKLISFFFSPFAIALAHYRTLLAKPRARLRGVGCRLREWEIPGSESRCVHCCV